MATMIPDQPPGEGGGKKAERALFSALRRGLPDDYYVYCNLRYLEGDRAREGEADFLVLHRTGGMLVIECKGEGVHCKDDGRWFRGTEPLNRSPEEQVQTQAKELREELERRMKNVSGLGWVRLPFVVGHALAFPRCHNIPTVWPLSLQPELLYDSRDLARMAQRVRETMAFWRRAAPGVKPPTEADFNRFRRQVLHPQLAIVPRLGAEIDAEAEALHRLSEEQADLLDGLLHNRRLTVAGGAGSGKTLMALEAARQLAGQGRSVQVLCYNKALGSFLQRCAGAMDTGTGTVRARHFHGLCFDGGRAREGEQMRVPADKGEAAAFWDDEAPMAVLEALEAGQLDRVDDVVVDEGQDFHAGWWAVVEDLLRSREDGRLFIFHDAAQEIFGREFSIPGGPAQFRLTRNFRNTWEIGSVVHRLGRVRMSPCERCPRGKPPSVYRQGTRRETLKQLDGLLSRMLTGGGVRPEQVVILTPHTRKNSTLAGVSELASVELSGSSDRREGKLLHTTIGAFKGLESDVVIMLDVDPEDERCGLNARYVAASRARHRLHVFTRGDWMEGT